MFRKLFFYTSNVVTIVAPIVLLFLPATFFDKGESVCLSVQLANMQCYACGMTKAVMHFIHFDFEGAYSYNKLSFIVFPLFFGLIIMKIRELYRKLIV